MFSLFEINGNDFLNKVDDSIFTNKIDTNIQSLSWMRKNSSISKIQIKTKINRNDNFDKKL